MGDYTNLFFSACLQTQIDFCHDEGCPQAVGIRDCFKNGINKYLVLISPLWDKFSSLGAPQNKKDKKALLYKRNTIDNNHSIGAEIVGLSHSQKNHRI
jgi:hypothetical protein